MLSGCSIKYSWKIIFLLEKRDSHWKLIHCLSFPLPFVLQHIIKGDSGLLLQRRKMELLGTGEIDCPYASQEKLQTNIFLQDNIESDWFP